MDMQMVEEAIRLADKYGWRISYFGGKWEMDHPILLPGEIEDVVAWIMNEFEDK